MKNEIEEVLGSLTPEQYGLIREHFLACQIVQIEEVPVSGEERRALLEGLARQMGWRRHVESEEKEALKICDRLTAAIKKNKERRRGFAQESDLREMFFAGFRAACGDPPEALRLAAKAYGMESHDGHFYPADTFSNL